MLDGDLRVEVNFTVDSTAGATEDQLAAATQPIAANVVQQLAQDRA